MDAKPSRKGCHPANRISSPSARKAIHPDILLPADEISRALCYNIRMRPRAYNGGPAYAPRPALLKWLLDSDPALRRICHRTKSGFEPLRDCLQLNPLCPQPHKPPRQRQTNARTFSADSPRSSPRSPSAICRFPSAKPCTFSPKPGNAPIDYQGVCPSSGIRLKAAYSASYRQDSDSPHLYFDVAIKTVNRLLSLSCTKRSRTVWIWRVSCIKTIKPIVKTELRLATCFRGSSSEV